MTVVLDRFSEYLRRLRSFVGTGAPARGHLQLTVIVEPDEDDGGYVSSIVDLPGVRSQGETEREAVENVLDALRCALDASATAGEQTAQRPDAPESGARRIPVCV